MFFLYVASFVSFVIKAFVECLLRFLDAFLDVVDLDFYESSADRHLFLRLALLPIKFLSQALRKTRQYCVLLAME